MCRSESPVRPAGALASLGRSALTRSAPGARILLVDDDPEVTALALEMLHDEGYSVVTHARWEDAHRVAQEQRADLVVLDLRFEPGEMGWRVLELLRFAPSTRTVPIILWSSCVEVLAVRGPALLADDKVHVLAKPRGLDALASLVRRVLNAVRETGPAQISSTSTVGGDLTRREYEVARLVGRGYTNRRIAEDLVITQGTAANHVANILEKLGFANRTQLAAWVATKQMLEPLESPAP
jgi:DNA-binding NarL/FixJ family response regulator